MTALAPLPRSALCCQNERGPDWGTKGVGNRSQPRGVDRKTKRIRTLRCRTCQTEWSERQGTPGYPSGWSPEKGLALARPLAAGDGIRQTGRVVGVDQQTVMRDNRLLGTHGHALHQERVRHVRVREAPGDERWAFVGNTRGPRRPHRSRG
jgi:transposase-like protein